MTEWLGSITGAASDIVGSGLQSILYATIYKLLYYIASGLCWVLGLFGDMFETLSGLNQVVYDGSKDYLINVFFSNDAVANAYWGMALIGIVLCFAFAIMGVVKKSFDTNEKEKRSHGQILGSLFKSILIIISLSALMVVVLNASNILMQQINYVLINATDLDKEDSIEFTNEQYAAMARALNTVGNYSMNPSYNSRYNINSCFNEMRIDLMYLQDEGVFDFYYKTEDAKGNEIATWQSTLQKIANSADLEKDLKIDLYYESVSNSILEAMELLRVNSYFRPLESFERQYTTTTETIPIDRVVFLTGTLRAAKNSDYNESPSFTDPLRGAYYHGEKSIYDVDQVSADFDIGPATDYIIIFIMVIKLLWDFTVIILNCISRIFNMLVLYIAAPPFIATMSYDDGGKLKQWTTAFLVQSFAVFGSIIAMRLMLIFLPIIIGPELVLFDNPILNYFTKMVIILGAFEAAKKSNGIIIGILADNAGWQSISAGDMRNTARSLRDKVKRWVEGDGRSKGGSSASAPAPAAGKNDDKLPDKPEDAADKNDDNKNAEPEVFKGVPAAPQSKFDNMGRLVATEMWDPEKKTTVPIGNSSGKKGADGKGSGGNAGGGNAGGGNAGGGNIGGGNAGGGNVGGGNIGGGNIGGGNVGGNAGANLQQPPPLMYNQVPDGNGGGNNEPANPEGADNHE